MKKAKTTLKVYKSYKRKNRLVKASMFVTPVVPTGIYTAVNWSDWTSKAGISLPFGLIAFIMATILSVIAVLKSETIIKKKDILLLTFALVFMVLGISNMFLAKLFDTLGWLFMLTGMGLAGSYVEFMVDNKMIMPKVEEYKELVEKYALDPKSYAKKQADEKAKKEAEEIAEKEAKEKEDLGGLL